MNSNQIKLNPMKMNKIYPIIFLILCGATIIISSCKKGRPCEEPYNIKSQSEVVVTFIDKATGKYLYSEMNPLYDKDSLKVIDPMGNSLVILSALNQIPNTYNRYYVLSFGNIYSNPVDEASFNSETCKNYIVKYSFNESDTIQVCFKAQKTKCGSKFETIKVYQNGQEVGSETNTIGISVTIFKN